jgi:hypothetical protein
MKFGPQFLVNLKNHTEVDEVGSEVEITGSM